MPEALPRVLAVDDELGGVEDGIAGGDFDIAIGAQAEVYRLVGRLSDRLDGFSGKCLDSCCLPVETRGLGCGFLYRIMAFSVCDEHGCIEGGSI